MTTQKLQNRITRLNMLPMSRNIKRKITRSYRLMGDIRHRGSISKRGVNRVAYCNAIVNA